MCAHGRQAIGHIAKAIRLSRKTIVSYGGEHHVALGVKLAVLVLAAVGIANMWMAVLLMSVAILAILNAMRCARRRRSSSNPSRRPMNALQTIIPDCRRHLGISLAWDRRRCRYIVTFKARSAERSHRRARRELPPPPKCSRGKRPTVNRFPRRSKEEFGVFSQSIQRRAPEESPLPPRHCGVKAFHRRAARRVQLRLGGHVEVSMLQRL